MDYIIVTKDNGEEEVMEVVTIFNRSDSDYNYIIYTNLSNIFCYTPYNVLHRRYTYYIHRRRFYR